MRNQLLVLVVVASLIAALSTVAPNDRPRYLLRNSEVTHAADIRPPLRHGPLVYSESSTEFDGDMLSGQILSLGDRWTLRVGDPVRRFDQVLGFPYHIDTWPSSGDLRAIYFVAEGLYCYLNIDRQTGRVKRIALHRSNLMSLSISPQAYLSEEEKTRPGSWVQYWLGESKTHPWSGNPSTPK